MKITCKGQVTIPVEIREKLGFLPNTDVEFEVVKDALYLKKVAIEANSIDTPRSLIDGDSWFRDITCSIRVAPNKVEVSSPQA